jgi:HD superfamily phosphohydrolase
MNNEQLKKFKSWFDNFVAGFYSDDDFINANIKMKEEHSRRVCDEMRYLADELSLTKNQRLLAETIALLHDVGRFPQFTKYRTYNDPRSVNHCLLALDVIQKENLLSELPGNEKQLIETAIKYHGDKELPSNLTGDTLLLSKMIRDADKLDIFRVVTQGYKQYRDDPDNFKLEIELPDTPEYSGEVLDEVASGRLIDYKTLRTFNDMKLCQLGWVYDVNFIPTLNRIKQRRFLETIFEFLPDTEDIAKARQKVFAYIDSRISRSK